ncbi:MAG: hypothetical protein IPP15_07760 [Saprospiraceae bacterium]|uniref:DUF5777 domain-containing protein n=1 Tax=Candidatus Opimibacter skivensis TaxID=2982028 RepID=A0A9D7SU30_9BACT|nr:hypothetical protein [Candidatus Opimibacter skivensis]
MKRFKIDHEHFSSNITFCLIFLAAFFSCFVNIQAQDEVMPEKDSRPVKNTFESIWLLDNQTVLVPIKGTFEMDFQHRFGTWEKGYDDFFGIFAPSNMRIGFDYVPVDRLLVGFGFTKLDQLWDVYGKYALLRQGRTAGSPISLTYYVNAAMDTREKENTYFTQNADRWSFYHQLMIGRKITDDLSLQVSGNLSWFNTKAPVVNSEGVVIGRDQNKHFSASALARYKFSNTMGLIVEYDQPITDQKYFDPEPNLSIGLELVTSSHAFQVFVGNFQSLIPQYNQSFNANSFSDNQILIGFNITRLWNF